MRYCRTGLCVQDWDQRCQAYSRSHQRVVLATRMGCMLLLLPLLRAILAYVAYQASISKDHLIIGCLVFLLRCLSMSAADGNSAVQSQSQIGSADVAEPVPDERILKRKVIFHDPPPCPYLHACILKGCPFQHQRTLLQPSLRTPWPIRHSLCANDDCHAKALPGKFCCNPCEREYSGGLRLLKQCPAHEGACQVAAGSRHCAGCQGEEREEHEEHGSAKDAKSDSRKGSGGSGEYSGLSKRRRKSVRKKHGGVFLQHRSQVLASHLASHPGFTSGLLHNASHSEVSKCMSVLHGYLQALTCYLQQFSVRWWCSREQFELARPV